MRKIQLTVGEEQFSPETWADSVYLDEHKKTLLFRLKEIDKTLSSANNSYISETEEDGLYVSDPEGHYLFSLTPDGMDVNGMCGSLKKEIDNLLQGIHNSIMHDIRDFSAMIFEEKQAGTIFLYGQHRELYEMNAKLYPLPRTVNEKYTFKLASEPIGCNSYLNIKRFSVTDGLGGIISNSFSSAYRVNRIYTGEDLHAYAEVECVKTVDSIDASAIIGIEYVRAIGEKLHLELTFPAGTDLSEVSVMKPPLKYNKKCAFLYLTDDAAASCYNNFAYCSGRKYNPEGEATHYGITATEDNNSKRYYTDGCGTKIPFRFEVAMWPFNKISDSAPHNKNAQLTYREVEYFVEHGNMICSHDVYYNHKNPADLILHPTSYDEWDTTLVPLETDGTPEDIATGMYWTPRWLFAKTGVWPKALIEPGGLTTYLDAVRKQDTVCVYCNHKGATSYQEFMNFSRDNMALYRQRDMDVFNRDFIGTNSTIDNTENLIGYLQNIADSTDEKEKVIPCTGVHFARNTAFPKWDRLCETIGGKGTDVLWFTTMTEMYEYSYLRNRSFIKCIVADNKLIIDCLMPPEEHFYYKDFSLILSGVSLIPESEDLSDNIICERSALTADGLLVNINYNPLCLERVEKYVLAYEKARKAEDRFDAIELMAYLSDELQGQYMTRIHAVDDTLA